MVGGEEEGGRGGAPRGFTVGIDYQVQVQGSSFLALARTCTVTVKHCRRHSGHVSRGICMHEFAARFSLVHVDGGGISGPGKDTRVAQNNNVCKADATWTAPRAEDLTW